MVAEKLEDVLPIPTYDEAISSRPSSSRSQIIFEGPEAADWERQGLLGRDHGREGDGVRQHPNGYRPPTVESARTSIDSELLLASSDDGSEEDLRREMSQMEVLDGPSDTQGRSRSRIRSHLSKRLSSFTHSLSSIHLPFQVRMPSFNFIRLKLPDSTPGLAVFGRLVALFIVIFAAYMFISFITPTGRNSMGRIFDPESVREFAQSHVDQSRIKDYLNHLSAFDHVAGTKGDYALAKYVEGLFSAAKLENVEMSEYYVYLNYPKKGGRKISMPELKWEAELEEEPNETLRASHKQTLAFHGYSRAGKASGPLVYANYGSREDFQKLKEMGVQTKGAVILVRYYGSQTDRAMKVKAAELAGAVACIIYSDPADDGFVKGKEYPEGRWMPKNGVQRGTVGLTSFVVGDALTPGRASTEGAKRESKDGNPALVNIPSLPLSWRDAQKMLQSLEKHGNEAPQGWRGGVPEVSWWTGDSKSPVVEVQNEQDEEERTAIWNVHGQITGIENPEKEIIIGNHRDAWCLGAADPGSGTAVMLEIVRIFGEMVELGWRPLRTIKFASWDAEEYNLVGSTEWVEENVDNLRQNALAYLNVDTAVSGTNLLALGSPLFRRVLIRALDRTVDPNSNETLRALWDKSKTGIAGLGAGSDYVAFQDIAGTASLDLSFQGDNEGYPYHSCYDNFDWMTRFGDPTFAYHQTLAQVFILIILELSNAPIMPFDFEAYAVAVQDYVSSLDKWAKEKEAGENKKLDLTRLRNAANRFTKNAASFQKWEYDWEQARSLTGGYENRNQEAKRVSHNAQMGDFDTHLLDLSKGGGIPGRDQYKHVIYAPQAWSGYDEAYFPAVRDALDDTESFFRSLAGEKAKRDGDQWHDAQIQANRAARILDTAAKRLSPDHLSFGTKDG